MSLVKKIFFSSLLLLPLLFIEGNVKSVSPSSQLWLRFLDVGQGDSIFIETPVGNRVLNDGGPSGQVVEKIDKLVPMYDRSLDLLILSHADADHLTGLVEILRRYEVNFVIANKDDRQTDIYKEWLKLLLEKGIQPRGAFQGDRFWFGDVNFLVLWPPSPEYVAQIKEPNKASIVILISYFDFSALLTGDIDASVSSLLPPVGTVEVLKIPHHGAAQGLTGDFMKEVLPQVSVISVGKNSYGHPSGESMALSHAVGAHTLRTDQDGDILITSDGKNWHVYTENSTGSK